MADAGDNALVGVVEPEAVEPPIDPFDRAVGTVKESLATVQARLAELRHMRDEVIAIEIRELVAKEKLLSRMAAIPASPPLPLGESTPNGDE